MYRHVRLTKGQMQANEEVIDIGKNYNITPTRVFKTAAIPSAITAGWFMGDDDE